MLKCLLDTKTKASFKVLPFLLRTPMKRAQKTARLSPLAALRQMWAEFELSDDIFPVPLLLYIALLILCQSTVFTYCLSRAVVLNSLISAQCISRIGRIIKSVCLCTTDWICHTNEVNCLQVAVLHQSSPNLPPQ